MRIAVLMGIGCAIMLACGEKGANDSAGDSVQAAGMVASTLSLADIAGKWNVVAMPETGDSVLTTYELNGTADTGSWTVTFPDRDPIPAHVISVEGDSIIFHVGPYESTVRKGVIVESTATSRLLDGKLVGTFVARYKVTTADSVLRGRIEGSRM